MRIIEKVIQSNLEPTRQDVIWVDTSDPSVPVVKTYLNGKWEVTSPSGDGYVSVKSLTKEEYDALVEKDSETLYIVKNGLIYDIYLGEDKIVYNVTNITWANLVALRDNSMLIPGMQYRIIDYNTTTVQDDTQSAGHQFDIIVVADDDHTLNENARAAMHAEDTYFTNAKLEAWELKYCLDNDTTRFLWADSNPTGKGVIYYMKDEWENECYYDFKNIQFKVGAKTNPGTIINVFYYTFSVATGVDDATVTDHSLNGEYCYGNKIDILNKSDILVDSSKQTLPFNVFRNTIATSDCICNILGRECNSNTFGSGCSNNTFGVYCNNNEFGIRCNLNMLESDCHHNRFGNICESNTFGDRCSHNTFHSECKHNIFGNNCTGNTFGDECEGNEFGYECRYNTFGDTCISNTFGNKCNSNTLGNYCTHNMFDNYCQYNTFRYNCNSNTFGCECSYNTLGSNCDSNTFGEYVSFFITGNELDATQPLQTSRYIRYLIVENGVQNVNAYCTGDTTDSDYCQNIKIGLGVKGTSSNNRLQIDITSQINATASVTYEPTGSNVINV